MSRERLPLIGSSGSKTAKPPPSSKPPPRPHQTNRRQRSQQQTSSSSSSHPGRPCILLSDTTMTPWGSLALSESSFASIPRPPTSRPPAPPCTPYLDRQNEEEEVLSLSFNSPSPPVTVPLVSAGGGDREIRQRLLPQRRVPRPPRLPPLRPITDLSFSRSFTFSFFELPLHQSPHCRAERIRNLMLLLRQMHY